MDWQQPHKQSQRGGPQAVLRTRPQWRSSVFKTSTNPPGALQWNTTFWDKSKTSFLSSFERSLKLISCLLFYTLWTGKFQICFFCCHKQTSTRTCILNIFCHERKLPRIQPFHIEPVAQHHNIGHIGVSAHKNTHRKYTSTQIMRRIHKYCRSITKMEGQIYTTNLQGLKVRTKGPDVAVRRLLVLIHKQHYNCGKVFVW